LIANAATVVLRGGVHILLEARADIAGQHREKEAWRRA
jgi:hypothetical protein